ncbi:MAG: TonB-dependent siderophore receptor [Alteromonas macleodii]|jgi:iron complex outermembrane receptor protein|uniref:TonB-dependent siderophore receptor n=1 Tax=Alteromonas TaxID=226 RepID=UPI00128952F1|nr:TonB-dependent siderophore receptor [Alteromonas macleodii]MDM7961111.1 TonB-dependent siderophore receptor [Alteromonas macleodii]MDM8169937.1 TonB-dependent siderophore receptor [Alteromonas macleodii]CAI3952620.1 iron complex outermembrane receptor protein [Alteromonas macleodii]VTP54765.1 iron complex outermembrane receptor protein [Alteromonas macleodii]
MNKKLLSLAVTAILMSHAQAQEDESGGGIAIEHQAAATEKAEKNAVEKIEVVGMRSPFGATKTNTPIVELARTISIETALDLKQKGVLNLSQSATYMAGVTGESYGYATRVDSISSRGLSIPRYRDSIQELFGSYNSTRAEIYTMEQVELLKGPASVLYGQGSPGGIMNYVSKTPTLGKGSEVVLSYGSFDRAQVGLDVNGSLSENDKWMGRLVGIYRNADSQVDYVSDDTQVLMPSLSFMPSDNTTLTLIGLFQDTDSDTAAQFIPVEGTLLPLADGTYLPDQDVYAGEPGFNKFDTKSNQVTLLGEHLINDTTSLSFTALWRDGEADYHQAWATFTGGTRYLNAYVGAPVAPTDTFVPRTFYQADNTFSQHAFDVRVNKGFVTGSFEHELLAGVQYQNVKTDANSAYYAGGGVLQGDFRYILDLANPEYTGAPEQAIFDAIYNDAPEQTVTDTGLYLSDQISFENWRVTLGLRHDRVDNDTGVTEQDDTQTSYSAGILYRFDNGISPYLSYAESFETVVGLDNNNNQLKPEEGRQYEAGIKYELSSIPGFITLAYYDIEVSNLPNPNGLPDEAAQQQGVTTIEGFELEGRVDFGQITAQFAASVMDAEDPNGFSLSAQPDSNASLWINYSPLELEALTVGAGIRYVGESVSENGVIRYDTPSYTLGDLMVSYVISDNLDLQLNVRNVTDKKYLTSCLFRGDCFPGVRRTVNASLTYSF